MSNHTPGPWSYWSGYNPFDKIEAQVTAEDGDIVIASYNHLIEEGEANARLMAAAPDLLAALEALFQDYKELADSGDSGFWRLEDLEAGKQAIAAIDRAKCP